MAKKRHIGSAGTKLRFTLVTIAAGLITLGLLVAGSSAAPFAATFDGSPPAPLPLAGSLTNWDVQVHSRDQDTWFQLEPVAAQHGADCGAPPATHLNTSYEGAVFQCRDHIMTSMNASGYGVIYLTPNQIFDFSSGGSITFDMSTERMSTRDWIDVLITPWGQNLALPLLSDLSQGVDLQGYPGNLIHIGVDNGQSAPRLTVVQNGVASCPGSCGSTPLDEGIPASVNQAATRQPFKLTIANGRIRFERLASATAPAVVFFDTAAPLNFTSGVVQFGHHSYNPSKDDAGVPATWHWDNIALSSGIPFTMIKADRRYTQGGTVSFQQASPAGAYLRFSAICTVAVDGQVVQRSQTFGDTYHPEHMSSYFVPITAGKAAVNISFLADDWYEGPCIAKDFSVWSRGATQQATATPTLPPATPTNTPVATAASLSGRVTLEGRSNSAGVQVRIGPSGTTAITGADGGFQFSGLTAGGGYSITASLPGFVDARRLAIQLQAGSNSIGQTTLRAGDIDDDGGVTITDVSVVAGLYGTAGGPGVPADLTGDGAVDITDVSLVAGNYGLAGPLSW